jgi:hypothetical protein
MTMPRSLPLVLSLLAVPAAAGQEPAGPGAARQESAVPEQPATQDPAPSQAATFSTQQLEQLVAPIALYPDALLAQILMASTYPLEIVQAARWIEKNPQVTGQKLEAALKDETWDPSVKSLCGFPEVLARMSDNLDWTQDLGDAFLSQQSELMDTVQRMRRKAYEAGTLESSKELEVTEQADQIIVIQQADPEVIYVPTYYPTAVYGSWSYPYWYYPPLYPPPPAGAYLWGFTAGVVWGAAIWGGCNWGWGHTEIDIDIDRHNNFIDRTEVEHRRQDVKDRAGASDRAAGRHSWQHDPAHRKGVEYRDTGVAQRFGGDPGQTRISTSQARGYADRAAPGEGRASASTRERGGAPGADRTPPASTRSSGQRSSSFSGSRSPSLDLASSSRGSASRGSPGSRGVSRGGGGRGRR